MFGPQESSFGFTVSQIFIGICLDRTYAVTHSSQPNPGRQLGVPSHFDPEPVPPEKTSWNQVTSR